MPTSPTRVARTNAVLHIANDITAECQGSVFDSFYRVDENRSRSTSGTGLGLTLVRSLIEALAGPVSLRSQPSQGSVFTLSLPI